jgi:hypothetical protein
MEPNKISTVNDLHNEGVDIMGDAGADQDGVATVPVQRPAPTPVQPIAPAQPVAPAYRPAQTMARPSSSAQDEINRTLGIQTPTAQATVSNTQNDPSIKSVRTFKSDAEEAIRYGNVSATKISLAEQNRKMAREQAAPAEKSGEASSTLGKTAVALTILVILAAAGGYYFVYMKGSAPAAALPQELRVDTILPYAKASVLQLDGETNAIDTFAAAIGSTPIDAGTIHAFIAVPQGTTTFASIEDVFGKAEAPSTLKRSLSSRYMLGAHASDTKLPFIIVKNTYFQNAFAGMLEWEKSLRKNLLSIIRISNPAENISLSNSGTFEDSVISNVDARVLRNGAGEVILAYAFSDKNTLVIATRADSLKFILDKLLAVRVVQ